MRIQTSVHEDLTTVSVIGEFIGELVPRFNKAVCEAFDAGRRDFLIDLSQARALDSSALEALTALQRRTQEQLGMLQLCVPDATLRKILMITRLDQQFTFHASLEEARSAFIGAFVGQPAAGGVG